MNIRQLKIFAAVCREMNMSRAARTLYVSQSSVSQVIQDLEEEYNVRLFERMAKNIYLTQAGERLLFHANQVISSADRLERCMAGLAEGERLRVGATTTVAACLLHPLISRFEAEHPGAAVGAEVANSDDIIARLLTAGLDLAIVPGLPGHGQLRSQPVFADELVFVCPKGHCLEGRRVAADELEGQQVVLREEGSGTRRILEQAMSAGGISLNHTWICPGIHGTLEAVARGRGIALVSSRALERDPARGEVGTFLVENMAFTRTFYLVWHRDKYETEAMREFRALCGRFPVKVPGDIDKFVK